MGEETASTPGEGTPGDEQPILMRPEAEETVEDFSRRLWEMLMGSAADTPERPHPE